MSDINKQIDEHECETVHDGNICIYCGELMEVEND